MIFCFAICFILQRFFFYIVCHLYFSWSNYQHVQIAWRLGDVAVFENRQPVTAAKFINNSSLFILLPGVIRRLELKPFSEQKVENIFIAPPYCQAPACCAFVLFHSEFFTFEINYYCLVPK